MDKKTRRGIIFGVAALVVVLAVVFGLNYFGVLHIPFIPTIESGAAAEQPPVIETPDISNVELAELGAAIANLKERLAELEGHSDELIKLEKRIANMETDVESLSEAFFEFPSQQTVSTEVSATENTPVPKDRTSLETIPLPTSKDWHFDTGTVGDSLGNKYNMNYFHTGGSAWAEYYVNGQYTHLRGKIAPDANMPQGRTLWIRIYVDKGTTGQWELVYSSEDIEITRKTEPFDIDVNLGEAAKYMRIEISNGNWYERALLLLGFEVYN